MAARRATLDGEQLDLSPREFDLLAHLAERAGDVVTKRELLHRRVAPGDGAAPTRPSTCTCRGCAASYLGGDRVGAEVPDHGPAESASGSPNLPHRRQLIVTVAAVVSMVLLAMLVPMAVLVRDYAWEDELAAPHSRYQATRDRSCPEPADCRTTATSASTSTRRSTPLTTGIQTHRALSQRHGGRSSPGRGRPRGRGPTYRPGPGRRRGGRDPDAGARLPRREQRPAARHPGHSGARRRTRPRLRSRPRLAAARHPRARAAGRGAGAGRPAGSLVRAAAGRPGRTRTHAGHDRPADSRPRRSRDRGRATGGSRAGRDTEPTVVGRGRGAARARAAGSLRPVPSAAHPR